MNKKAQSISIDLIVVVSIVMFGVLFLVFNQINTQEDKQITLLSERSEHVSEQIFISLQDDGIIEDNNVVNVDELIQLSDEELKQELGISGDFAIAFEKDGKLVYIDSVQNISCLGSDKIIVNGKNCGYLNQE